MIPNKPLTLFLFQVAAHLSLLPMLMYASWWQWLVALFVYFCTGCLGMTMTYHRLLSHRSWATSKSLEQFFVLLATVGLTGSALAWVAIHRAHHKNNDTALDPHSPKHKGFLYVHFFSMFVSVRTKYARDLVRQKFYQVQHHQYFVINSVYALILLCLDPMALVYAWLFPAAVLWNAGSSIISFSHRQGRPHNDPILGLLVWGEGMHKNHHDHAGLSSFGRWDLGGWIIRRIER